MCDRHTGIAQPRVDAYSVSLPMPQELLDADLSELYPPASGSPLLGCQAGVRALPPRSHLGYVPLAGELPGSSTPSLMAAAAGTAFPASDVADAADARMVTAVGEFGACAPAANMAVESRGNGRPAPRLWLLAGLGSRGLIHHALLSAEVARAVLAEDSAHIPEHARRWEKCLDDVADAAQRGAASCAPRAAEKGLRIQGSGVFEYERAEGAYN